MKQIQDLKLPYSCPICDKFFISKGALKDHLKSQTHEKELKKRKNK